MQCMSILCDSLSLSHSGVLIDGFVNVFTSLSLQIIMFLSSNICLIMSAVCPMFAYIQQVASRRLRTRPSPITSPDTLYHEVHIPETYLEVISNTL